MMKWVAASRQDVIDRAANFAQHRAALLHTKMGLRANILVPSLCETGGFGRAMNHIFAGLWASYCNNNTEHQG
jgi:predicted O-linked N-acetylglucosamine transferase (SPINDLY family)